MDKTKLLKYVLFPLLIFAAWLGVARYTFNEKPDLNGDNFCEAISSSEVYLFAVIR